MGKIERLIGDIDLEIYRRLDLEGLSDYERNKLHNSPTHFSFEEGKNGFDKVNYFRIIK
jgi:hypothetical protein